MLVYKFNPLNRQYKEIELPKRCRLLAQMDDLVACANCGELTSYSNMFTSKRYHTSTGFGYPECEKCYYQYFDYCKNKGVDW